MKKTIVITGGTGGIGHAAAIALAKRGADFIIQGRDALMGNMIMDEMSKSKGSTCKFIQADLSTIDGIKNLAAEIKKLTNKIDVLIHSTGTLNSVRKESKDGLDEGFTINYLTKFMLDNLLQNELRNGEGKVIIVGAPLMKNAAINFDDLQMKNGYSLMKGMGQNMLAVHMHAQELTKRGGVTINVINPGVVKTGILRNTKGPMKFMFNLFGPLISNSPEKAVVNILELTNTSNKESGYFYAKVAKPSAREKINLDVSVATKLWDESMKIAKI
jgi:NAD(P)-dependent dehydrogenase (short-subunit alcohol dehydrogenase family)